ncbi:uncharacterized protein LOC116349459 [Contarinia nasturtii]|uniref:uncharacterized protein LOC116349459 n=1 Tax=Contarinia nasturtii TaxID=265458 RepID=UPI0012D449A1|nr:uncharacterized protein LOC116349459 [Contarinia nasturtii]
MTSNILNDEIVRWLSVIDIETTRSLNFMKEHLLSSGSGIDPGFKINLLKSANYRLMEIFKRFEMALQIERSLKISTNERNTIESDIQMVENTPFAVARVDQPNVKSTPYMMIDETINLDANEIEVDVPMPQQNFHSNDLTVQEEHVGNISNAPMSKQHIQSNSLSVQKGCGDVKTNNRKEWMCFHCNEAKVQNIKDFVFSTLDELNDHWRFQHSALPFKYLLIDLMQCHIGKCRYFSNFQGLRKHHHKQHQKDIFVAAQNGRCVLCFYAGKDLDKHHCEQLDLIIELRLSNPVMYTEETVAELQTLNGNRRFDCKHCNIIFDTQQEVMYHHRKNHGHQVINIGINGTRPIAGLICGCCKMDISPQTHVSHLKAVAQERWSKGKTWNAWYRQFIMDFLKTKVLFDNGLVVYKQNLVATNIGGYSGFKNLAEQLYESLNA